MKLVPILFFLSINVNVNVIASDVAPVDIKDFATQSLNNIPMNNKDFSKAYMNPLIGGEKP
jgi:hypothetical protein